MNKTGQSYQRNAGIFTASLSSGPRGGKNDKAHTLAETVIVPAKSLVRLVIGDDIVAKLKSVSLSSDRHDEARYRGNVS